MFSQFSNGWSALRRGMLHESRRGHFKTPSSKTSCRPITVEEIHARVGRKIVFGIEASGSFARASSLCDIDNEFDRPNVVASFIHCDMA